MHKHSLYTWYSLPAVPRSMALPLPLAQVVVIADHSNVSALVTIDTPIASSSHALLDTLAVLAFEHTVASTRRQQTCSLRSSLDLDSGQSGPTDTFMRPCR